MLDSKEAVCRREYLKQWRKRNPDKVRQYNATYWKRRAEREQQNSKEVKKDG